MSAKSPYLKHVRGSRYVYSSKGIFYRFSYKTGDLHPENDFSEYSEKIQNITGNNSGRVYINENKEMIGYAKEEDGKWHPYSAGKIKPNLSFKGFDSNPISIETGLAWTGLLAHHGAKYKFNGRGEFYFEEVSREGGVYTKRKYIVNNAPDTLIHNLHSVGKYYGSFRVNEHLHVFTPVPKDTVIEHPKNKKIIEQFRNMTDMQRNALQQYQNSSNHIPLYVGKLDKPFEINRPDGERVISSFREVE